MNLFSGIFVCLSLNFRQSDAIFSNDNWTRQTAKFNLDYDPFAEDTNEMEKVTNIFSLKFKYFCFNSNERLGNNWSKHTKLRSW